MVKFCNHEKILPNKLNLLFVRLFFHLCLNFCWIFLTEIYTLSNCFFFFKKFLDKIEIKKTRAFPRFICKQIFEFKKIFKRNRISKKSGKIFENFKLNEIVNENCENSKFLSLLKSLEKKILQFKKFKRIYMKYLGILFKKRNGIVFVNFFPTIQSTGTHFPDFNFKKKSNRKWLVSYCFSLTKRKKSTLPRWQTKRKLIEILSTIKNEDWNKLISRKKIDI